MSHRVALSTWQNLIEEAKQANLPAVAEGLGFRLRREGRSFRVPGHGGLILWQGPDGWRWTWFSQGRSGDAISFLQEFAGFSFREAVEVLSGERLPNLAYAEPEHRPEPLRMAKINPQGKQKKQHEDPKKWQEKAMAFVEWAHEKLTGPEGEAVRRWLSENRGISEETAHRFKLGFNPEEFYRSRKAWGLSVGDKKKLWLPPGLVIPRFDPQEELIGITIRLFKPNEAAKYGLHTLKNCQIRYYSVPGPLKREIWTIGAPGSPLIVVESELDLLLLSRLADDCALAALGSAGRKPGDLLENLNFRLVFLTAPFVLLALDNDEAGKKASKWWTERYCHVHYWPTKEVKDPRELWKAGGDEAVQKWLSEGLEQAESLVGKDWQTLEPIKRAWFFIEVDRLAHPVPSEILPGYTTKPPENASQS